MEFTEMTQRAIAAVAQECIPDMEPGDAADRIIVAEVALDADRLAMWGHKAANDEVKELVRRHGWMAVCTAAAQFVPTA